MLEIVFLHNKTGVVNYAVPNVVRIRYITPSEIGFDKKSGERIVSSSCAFSHTERIEICHTSESPWRIEQIPSVSHE